MNKSQFKYMLKLPTGTDEQINHAFLKIKREVIPCVRKRKKRWLIFPSSSVVYNRLIYFRAQEVSVTSRGFPSAPARPGSPPLVWDRGWGWCTRCAALRRPAGAGWGLGSDRRTETEEGRRWGTETGHTASHEPPRGDRSSESCRWPESISEETQENAFIYAFTSTQISFIYL